MADQSKIEWTDATWNVITGCKVKSPGCTNCYAMKLAGTRLRNHPSRAGLTIDSAAGPVWNGAVRFNADWLKQPLQWKRPRMIFVVAHGDLFYEEVPDEWIDRVFAVMLLAGQHTFQCLTKRPDRALAYLRGIRTYAGLDRLQAAARSIGYTLKFEDTRLHDMPCPRIWIGTSVEDQKRADERMPFAASIAKLGWRTWVSYEPALRAVDWAGWEFTRWIVSGGESGDDARPHHPDWHRATRDYCAAHGIAYHFKQWGSWQPICEQDSAFTESLYRSNRKARGDEDQGAIDELYGRTCTVPYGVMQLDGRFSDPSGPMAFGPGAMTIFKVGKKTAGRKLDGRTHDEFPAIDNGARR